MMRAWFSALLMALVVVATSGAASRIRANTSDFRHQAHDGELQRPAQSGPAPKPKEAKKEFDCAVNSGALSAAGLKIAEQYGKSIALPAAQAAAKQAAAEYLKEQALKSGAKAVTARALSLVAAESVVYFEGLVFWTGWGAVLIVGGVALYKAFGDDPVDPHFMVIATPNVRTVQPVRVGPGVTGPGARAINALRANLANFLAVSVALITSNNRAQGAAAAGDARWTRQQTAAFEQYALQAAALLDAQPRLRTDLRKAWEASRATYRHIRPPATFDLSVAQMRKVQSAARTTGLPPEMVQRLQDLGADNSMIASAGKLIASSPVNTSVSFPSMLTDPGLDSASAVAADGLRRWAAAVAAAPQAFARPAAVTGMLRGPAKLLGIASHSTGVPQCRIAAPSNAAVPTPTPAASKEPTKLTLTVTGTSAESTVNHRSTYVDLASPLHFGTTLTVQAVTDAPMPQSWLLHIYRTGMQDPKLGGYLQLCHTVTTTCSYSSAEMPALTKQYDTVQESVFAVVSAPTYTALNSQITFNWKKQ